MLTSSVLVWVVVMVMAAEGQRAMQRRGGDEDIPDCSDFGSIYQRSRLECPSRAVCADVWNTIRDWYNGTRCRDSRVTYNCMCPYGEQCPIDNPDHVLYGNDKHSQYTCQPACDLERCNTTVRPAKEMVVNMLDRRGFRYYRINCRCYNHHVPLVARGRRGLNRATRLLRVYFDYSNNELLTQYKCVNLIPQNEDPCNSYY